MVTDYYSPENPVKRLRTLVIGILVFVVAMLLAINLYRYLTTGQIVITTNNPSNSVTVTRNLGDNHKSSSAYSVKGVGSLKKRVPAGTYTVTVSNKYFSVQKLVLIKARQSSHLSLAVGAPTNLEPVSSLGAHNLIATATGLLFINRQDGSLSSIDAQNNFQVVDPSHYFQNVQWANPSFGVGQTADGQLFSISNGTATPLSAPFLKPTTQTTFSVASDGTIYLASNNTLYRGNTTKGFQNIYHLDQASPLIVAGTKSVAIFEGGANGVSRVAGSQNPSNQIIAIGIDGVVHKISESAYEASWSPDGTLLAITDDSGTSILDASLRTVQDVPTKNVTAPSWLSSSTLVYGVTNGIWSYDMNTHLSNELAKSALDGVISEIWPSQDGDYVYVSVYNQNATIPNYQLSRFGLKGQRPLAGVEQLQVYLPNTVGGCALDYIAFTGVTVVASGASGQDQVCTQQAQNYIQGYRLNLPNVAYSFRPTTGQGE